MEKRVVFLSLLLFSVSFHGSYALTSKQFAKKLNNQTVRIRHVASGKYLSVKEIKDSAWMTDLPSVGIEAFLNFVSLGYARIIRADKTQVYMAHDKKISCFRIPKLRLVADADKSDATEFKVVRRKKTRFIKIMSPDGVPLFSEKNGRGKRKFAKHEVAFHNAKFNRQEHWQLSGELGSCYLKNRSNDNYLTIPGEEILSVSKKRRLANARRFSAKKALRKYMKKKICKGNITYVKTAENTAWTALASEKDFEIKTVDQDDLESVASFTFGDVQIFIPFAGARMRIWAKRGKWKGPAGVEKKQPYPRLRILSGKKAKESKDENKQTEFAIEIVE